MYNTPFFYKLLESIVVGVVSHLFRRLGDMEKTMTKLIIAMLVLGGCATVELSAEPGPPQPVESKKVTWIFFIFDDTNKAAAKLMAIDPSLPPLKKDNVYLGKKAWGLPCINGGMDEVCYILPESPGIEIGINKTQVLARQVGKNCRLTFKAIKVSFHPTIIDNTKGYLYKFSPDDESVAKEGDCPP